MVKKLLELFLKKNCKKTKQKKFRERNGKEKEMETNYMLNQKVAIIHLIAGLMKNNAMQK